MGQNTWVLTDSALYAVQRATTRPPARSVGGRKLWIDIALDSGIGNKRDMWC
jgi:hypothetical protein